MRIGFGKKKDDFPGDKLQKGNSTRRKAKLFLNRLTFNNLISSGYSPEDAARRVGVNVRPGERLRPKDYLDLKTKGEIAK